jgi:hypothetical protein
MTLVVAIVALLVYSTIGSYFWRRWAWESFKRRPYMGKGDALFVGLMQAVIWPVALSWRVLAQSDTFMLAPPDVRAKDREAMLQARIDKLERDLQIKDRA